MNAFWCLSTAAVWYSVQASQSWSCWGIQDTSPPARVGWGIYWNALVPQSHIPVIDLLKHYHSQLGLAVQLSPISLCVLINEGLIHSQPLPPHVQLQWDHSQLTYIVKYGEGRLVFLNQAGSNFYSTIIVMVMMKIMRVNKIKEDDGLRLLWAIEQLSQLSFLARSPSYKRLISRDSLLK